MEEYLISLGIPSHIKGFSCIRTALELMSYGMYEGTMDLYNQVAVCYDTNYRAVERNIRRAFEVAWLRGTLKDLFVDIEKMPTNTEILSTIYKLM